MLNKLYPYEYVDSVFSINFNELYKKGYRGIIFDIDNTLVHHGEDSTKEIDELFREIQKIGFKTLLLSNNGEERINRFLKNIKSLYISNAQKPKKSNYLKALKMLNLNKKEVVFIGDQIFTDILGANRSGIPNILVKVMYKENETNFGKRRQLENVILEFYRRNRKAQNRIGNIEGRVIKDNKLIPGTGGGLCNLANTINNLILNSPLEIVEFHKHSDALAPDNGKRIPLANGTSVSYNYIDYRFKNNTSQNVQLLLWCDDEKLYGELRSENEIPWKYEIIEENHHFEKEGDKYYRISQIYRNTIERETGNIIKKELIWDNHSMVMFDYDLIPKELIKNDSNKKELEKF